MASIERNEIIIKEKKKAEHKTSFILFYFLLFSWRWNLTKKSLWKNSVICFFYFFRLKECKTTGFWFFLLQKWFFLVFYWTTNQIYFFWALTGTINFSMIKIITKIKKIHFYKSKYSIRRRFKSEFTYFFSLSNPNPTGAYRTQQTNDNH